MGEIEAKAFRVPVFQAFRLLIVTGNALLYHDDKGRMRVYRLDQYVVVRDPMGSVLEIIIKELVHPLALKKETREYIKGLTSGDDNVKSLDKDKDLESSTLGL